MDRRKDENRVVPIGQPTGPTSPLPYAIELWDLPRVQPERIVGCAASATLARAIFLAAQREHLGRRLVLRRGGKVLAESG
jgi:hypothetical protein